MYKFCFLSEQNFNHLKKKKSWSNGPLKLLISLYGFSNSCFLWQFENRAPSNNTMHLHNKLVHTRQRLVNLHCWLPTYQAFHAMFILCSCVFQLVHSFINNTVEIDIDYWNIMNIILFICSKDWESIASRSLNSSKIGLSTTWIGSTIISLHVDPMNLVLNNMMACRP